MGVKSQVQLLVVTNRYWTWLRHTVLGFEPATFALSTSLSNPGSTPYPKPDPTLTHPIPRAQQNLWSIDSSCRLSLETWDDCSLVDPDGETPVYIYLLAFVTTKVANTCNCKTVISCNPCLLTTTFYRQTFFTKFQIVKNTTFRSRKFFPCPSQTFLQKQTLWKLVLLLRCSAIEWAP